MKKKIIPNNQFYLHMELYSILILMSKNFTFVKNSIQPVSLPHHLSISLKLFGKYHFQYLWQIHHFQCHHSLTIITITYLLFNNKEFNLFSSDVERCLLNQKKRMQKIQEKWMQIDQTGIDREEKTARISEFKIQYITIYTVNPINNRNQLVTIEKQISHRFSFTQFHSINYIYFRN